MFEEEPFIRAIVDHPRDDLPRLIYADWLDERDDRRATYLRAELSWAEGRRASVWAPPTAEEQDSGVAPALQSLALGLDAVWIARVSRPPMGVCCDHLVFKDSGPRIEASDLDLFERRIGFALPHDYRGFLLNTNGGTPSPGCYVWTEPDATYRDYWPISHFNSLFPDSSPPGRNILRDAYRAWGVGIEELRGYIEIGLDVADWLIMLKLTVPHSGRVVGLGVVMLDSIDPIARALPFLLDSIRDHPYANGFSHNSGKESTP